MLDEAGSPLGAGAFHVADGVTYNHSLAAGERGWLLAWSDDRHRLRAVRIDTEGHVPDAPLDLGPSLDAVSVAFDDTHWVVAWVKPDGFASYGNAVFQRILPDGTLVDAEPVVFSPRTTRDSAAWRWRSVRESTA